MNTSRYFQHVGIALVLALLSSVGFFVIVPVFGVSLFSAFALPAISLAYMLFLFYQTREKTGRATCLLLWATMTLLIGAFDVPLDTTLALHMGAIWLIRSLYFYQSVVSSLLDLVLSVLSIAIGTWCYFHTGSLFLSVWSLFLTQAFCVTIPPSLRRREPADSQTTVHSHRFNAAHRNAEAALRQLFTQ